MQNAAERAMTMQPAVDARAARARVVKRRDQKQHADDDHGDALKDAQRTRREAEHVLRVQRIRHQCGAGEKTERVRRRGG